MYAYGLYVQLPGANTPDTLLPVRPGPDLYLPTVEDLHRQFVRDFGFVPDWARDLPAEEYIGVEHEEVVDGVYFLVDVEGNGNPDDHLAPVAKSLAFELNSGLGGPNYLLAMTRALRGDA